MDCKDSGANRKGVRASECQKVRKGYGQEERQRHRDMEWKRDGKQNVKKDCPNAWSNQLMLNVKLCPNLGSEMIWIVRMRWSGAISSSITIHRKYLFI